MDRRSFDLNFENNILFYDADLTAAVRQWRAACMAHAFKVTAATPGPVQ